jgi:hypothetical protein
MASFIHSPKNTRRISSKVGKLKISSEKKGYLQLRKFVRYFIREEDILSFCVQGKESV